MMSEIGLGEILRVFGALGVRDGATHDAVRDLLLPELVFRPIDERPRAPDRIPTIEPRVPSETHDEPQFAAGEGCGVLVPRPPDAPEIPYIATPLPTEVRGIQLPSADSALPRDNKRPLESEPLLDRIWARRVIGGLLTTEAPLGQVDVPSLTRRLLAFRDLRRLPRKLRATMRLGAQVLLDRDPSMMVFYSDQSALRLDIEGIGGRERTEVLRCDRFPPSEVCPMSGSSWRPYLPPRPGTPVLVVSDLGMARGAFLRWGDAAEAAWNAFLAPLTVARCPVLALVPSQPERYPEFVQRRVRLLAWDGATRPSDARRARRAVLR